MRDVRLTHIGGPTVLIEVAGWRLLTDPTFDPPGRRYSFGWGTASRKLTGPAVAASELAPIDAVLLSHDHHGDNLDTAGRALLASADQVVTTAPGARRLGGGARGLEPRETTRLDTTGKRAIEITATPGRHGPVRRRSPSGRSSRGRHRRAAPRRGAVSGDRTAALLDDRATGGRVVQPHPAAYGHPCPLRGLEALPGEPGGHRARIRVGARRHPPGGPLAPPRRRRRALGVVAPPLPRAASTAR